MDCSRLRYISSRFHRGGHPGLIINLLQPLAQLFKIFAEVDSAHVLGQVEPLMHHGHGMDAILALREFIPQDSVVLAHWPAG